MKNQAGFTAVEVLVTLAIAVLLVGGAYQAYGVVLNSTSEANTRSIASNLAYSTLREQASVLGNPSSEYSGSPTTCSTQTVPGTIPSGTLLPAPSSLSTVRTCPYGTAASQPKLITTTLTYGDKEVKHAILVN